MRSFSAAFVTASLCLAAAASADVLWDQSQLIGSGIPNTISGSPPFGSTMYVMNDIVVPAGGWTINSITTYFSGLGFQNWPAEVTQARLSIFARTGTSPIDGQFGGNNPSLNGTMVGLTCTTSTFDAGPGYGDQNVNVATAGGLNIHLDAGDYWIGLTPVANGGFDLEYGWCSSTVFGGSSVMWTPFGGFGSPPAYTWNHTESPLLYGVALDSAMLIQGVPTPGVGALLGIAGLAGLRRRR